MQSQEFVSSARRANLETAFGFAGTMIEGIGKLAELNARFTRSAMKNALEMAQDAAEKPGDWVAIQSVGSAPIAEQIQSYSTEFWGIVSSAQAEVLKAAQTESDVYVRRLQTLVEDASKHGPSGSEAAIAAWSSAITATHALYQTLGKTGQQAVEVARSNLDMVVAAASKGAKHTVGQAPQTAKR